LVQRVRSAKDEGHAKAATIFAGFLKILPVFILVLPGLIVRALSRPVQDRRVETCNAVPAALDKNAAARLLPDKVRRLLFSQGFFRLRDLNICVRASGATVHIPYWVGFYGDGDRASMRVVDAVRCRTEGAKMRDALARWLCA
jgi:hypothetical protein